MKKISILIDARMINDSGIGVYIQKIIAFLIEDKDFKVTLYGNSQTLRDYNLNVIASTRFFKQIINFLLTLKSTKFDLIWYPHYRITPILVKSKKRISTVHDMYHFLYLEQFLLKDKIVSFLFFYLCIKKSSKIITDSNFSKNKISYYSKKYFKKKDLDINTIYLAADNNQLNSSSTENKFKYLSNQKYFLFVGNLSEHKNLKRTINAFNSLNKNFNVKLVIVGKITSSIHFKEIEEMLNEKVILTGYVNDLELQFIYKNAYCFIFPSIHEGFGLPPLEAMFYNIPVIASNETCIPEICKDGAYYFNPFNEEEIINAMKEILINLELRNKLIVNGKNTYGLYSWKSTYNQHKEIFIEKVNECGI